MATKEIKWNYDPTAEKFQNIGRITEFADKWTAGEEFSEKDVENLIKELVVYVFDWHEFSETYDKALPTISLSNEIGSTTNGHYLPGENKIEFNITRFLGILNATKGEGYNGGEFEKINRDTDPDGEQNGFANIIKTVAHEIQHYFQWALLDANEDDLSHEEKEKREKLKIYRSYLAKEVISFVQSSDKVEANKIIEDFLKIAPYFSQQWDLVENDPEIVDTIRFAYYLTNVQEADARESGGIVSRDLVEKIYLSKKADPSKGELSKTADWAELSLRMADKDEVFWADKANNSKEYESLEKLEDSVGGIEEFIAFAKSYKEKTGNGFQPYVQAFDYAQEMFLKDRSLDEKVHIYKNAIYHGLSSLAFSTWRSIRSSADRESFKKIQEEIVGCFKSGSIVTTDTDAKLSESEKLDESAYAMWLPLDFTEKQRVETLMGLIKNGKIIYASVFAKSNFRIEIMEERIGQSNFEECKQLLKTQIETFFANQSIRPIQEKGCFDELAKIFEIKDYFDAMANKYPVPNNLGEAENVKAREDYFVQTYGVRQYIKTVSESGKPGIAEKIEKLLYIIENETKEIVSEEKIDVLIDKARELNITMKMRADKKQEKEQKRKNEKNQLEREKFVGDCLCQYFANDTGKTAYWQKYKNDKSNSKSSVSIDINDVIESDVPRVGKVYIYVKEEEDCVRCFWTENKEDFLEGDNLSVEQYFVDEELEIE